jgi:hypothetical protein
MEREQRKFHRRKLQYPARIDCGDGSPARPCLLDDISASGARVTMETTKGIPDRLLLLLASNPGALRGCDVVWRDDKQLGLKFVNAPKRTRPRTRNKRAFDFV